MNMIDRSFLPLVLVSSRSWSSKLKVGLTCLYTMKILRTIRPVTRAFAVKDMMRLIKKTAFAQLAVDLMPESDEKYHEQ